MPWLLFPCFIPDVSLPPPCVQVFRAHLRAAIAVATGTGIMLTIKTMSGDHTVTQMYGYIQKDAGLATYNLHTKNVTGLELAQVHVC